MADSASNAGDANTPKAAKDKNCPFCGQAFTSSSLGRHLDLYIKEKNPKAADGVHDVEAIKKLRGNITRRQPRGSIRRDTSTPGGTPTASKKSPASEDAETSIVKSPVTQRDLQQNYEAIGKSFPFQTGWEATGVINDIPKSTQAGDTGADTGRSTPLQQRQVSRHMMKNQLDARQKVQDALDTARAAELALREIIGSWRAAKQNIEMNSMPFDFEPLALDFPALTLQCLEPPPTLYSSTQHPTSTSWSILPPGQKQFEALQTWFAEEFRKWKLTCASATTALYEELTYPPTAPVKPDTKEAIRKAEKTADAQEKQVNEHIVTTFTLWENLPQQRRNEVWLLELARGLGRKHKEVQKLQENQHSLSQEVANLKSQIEHLNRLQQPREFKILTPATIPIDRKVISWAMEEAVTNGKRGVGTSMDDRHLDLNTIVSSAIDRWKNVIVATRSASGMTAQRSLDPVSAGTSLTSVSTPAAGAAGNFTSINPEPLTLSPQKQNSVPTLQNPPLPRHHSITGRANGQNYAASAAEVAANIEQNPSDNGQPSTAPTTEASSAPPSGDEEEENANEDDDMSDQDADAEMEDDDGFAAMSTPIVTTPVAMTKTPQLQQHQATQQQLQHQALSQMPNQQAAPLEVPRTRGTAATRFPANAMAQNQLAQGNRSVTHTGHGGRAGMTMRGAMQNVANMQQHGRGGAHNRTANNMAMQGVAGGGDPMYMD